MSSVSLSDRAKAVSALEEERQSLFRESKRLGQQQAELLQQMRLNSNRQLEVLRRVIAIEDTQSKMLVVL